MPGFQFHPVENKANTFLLLFHKYSFTSTKKLAMILIVEICPWFERNYLQCTDTCITKQVQVI